jgi:hypothetical protein
MPILIDGNNLLHNLRNGASSRAEVRRLVLDACRGERMRVTVVFDGPPPAGVPDHEALGSVTVLYSGSLSADDVIIRSLPDGRRARDWVVVTDDRDLGERAKGRGAQVRPVSQWRSRRPSSVRRPSLEPKLSSREVADWERYFEQGQEESNRE